MAQFSRHITLTCADVCLMGVLREVRSCEWEQSPTPFSCKVEERATELCCGADTLLHSCLDTSAINLL